MAFYIRDNQPKAPWKLAVMSFGSTGIIKTFELPAGLNLNMGPLWGPDGRTITFSSTADGISKIWSQSITGGSAVEVTDSPEPILRFAWSKHGELAVSRGISAEDIMLVSDFR